MSIRPPAPAASTTWVYEGFSWSSLAVAALFALGMLAISYDVFVLGPAREDKAYVMRALRDLHVDRYADESRLTADVSRCFAGTPSWRARLSVPADRVDAFVNDLRDRWADPFEEATNANWPIFLGDGEDWWQPATRPMRRILILKWGRPVGKPTLYVGVDSSAAYLFSP